MLTKVLEGDELTPQELAEAKEESAKLVEQIKKNMAI